MVLNTAHSELLSVLHLHPTGFYLKSLRMDLDSSYQIDNAMEGMYSPGVGAQRQDRGCSEGGCVIIDPFRCLRPQFLHPLCIFSYMRLTISPTVAVTLTPLDPCESSEARTFSLNKEKRQVDVGRASRNPDRGAQPSSDNAIFKCPIMSRLHARFTASPIEKVRKYSRDIISTRPN